jgi:alkylated DNA repair dioxygenase AlkB
MKAPKLFYDTKPKNIIPRDGEAIYYGPIFHFEAADRYLNELLKTIPFESEDRVMYGKHIITKRKIAWYGSKKNYAWPNVLLEIKKKVEEVTGVEYDGVFCNLYEDGSCGLGWHNDEESMHEDSSISSVSFGEERRFDLRYMGTKEKYSIVLEHGALLVMQGVIQKYWEHHIPKSTQILGPRINLTFRKRNGKLQKKNSKANS